MAQKRREDAGKKRAIRDVLAYEDTITMEMEQTVLKIRERAKVLHHELDRYITNMLSQLKKRFEQEVQRVRYAVDKLKGINRPTGDGKFSSRVSSLGDGKSSSRVSSLDRSPMYRSTPRSSKLNFSLNSSTANTEHFLDIDETDQFQKRELKLYEGEASDKVLEKLVGFYTFEVSNPISLNLANRQIQANKSSEIRLLKTFKCGDQSETVHAIAPVSDNEAWICCGWGSRTLHLYDRHGYRKKAATLDIQINDATTFNDGKEDMVLVSSYREKSIKQLNQDSMRTSDFAYISLYPGGLCSDRKQGIYVCFRDNYQRAVTFGSRRMIGKLSKHGDIVATIEKNEEQKNIFGYPFRLAVNSNGDICVSDYGEGTRGVTILHKDGSVKFVYKGPPAAMANDQPFLPHGIVCDDDGHILVSDWNNDCVQVLDREGNFLMNLITNKDGVEGPNALALDKQGHLWVGDSHGIIRIYKYSIVDE